MEQMILKQTKWNLKAIILLSLLVFWFDSSFYDLSYDSRFEESDRYYPKERTTMGPGYQLDKQNLHVGLFKPYLTVVFPMDSGYTNRPQRKVESFDIHLPALLIHVCAAILIAVAIYFLYSGLIAITRKDRLMSRRYSVPKRSLLGIALGVSATLLLQLFQATAIYRIKHMEEIIGFMIIFLILPIAVIWLFFPFRSYLVFLAGSVLCFISFYRSFYFLTMLTSDRKLLASGKTAAGLPLLFIVYITGMMIILTNMLFFYRWFVNWRSTKSPKDLNNGSPGCSKAEPGGVRNTMPHRL